MYIIIISELLSHCVQGSNPIAEDVVGKEKEDSRAKTKAEMKNSPSKNAAAQETLKVNTSSALLPLCNGKFTLLTLFSYIKCLSGCIILIIC